MSQTIPRAALVIAAYLLVAVQTASAQTPETPSPPKPVPEYSAGSWKTFAPAEGAFTISMPGIPESSTRTADTEFGPLVMHLHVLATELGQYGVAYSDFPGKANEPNFIQGLFAGSREGILNGSAKALNENEVAFSGTKGRELIAEQRDAVGRYRWFFVNERLYTLVFITTSEVAFKNGKASSKPGDRTEFYQTTCDKFFGSFTFAAPAPGLKVNEQPSDVLEPANPGKELYPPSADAKKEIEEALSVATTEKKRVLLVFGANWCYDCHVLDQALHKDEAGKIVSEHFLLVHVDIGEGEKNLDLVKLYKVPLDRGVPAVAILDNDGQLLYSSGQGEFEAARRMMKKDLVAFLKKWQPKDQPRGS
jgi:hypothetical protein